jgi:hypothetical protein
MRRTITTFAALCAALALTAGAAAAQGTLADRTTFVTFSGPVSLPGTTLPAGTYTFRLADSQTDRHIVQVFNREGTKLFTTLLAVPAQRNEASGDPVITFKETPSDRPPAVHYWYYAGEKDGNELVYPKAQAMAIAKASGEPVMAVESSSPSIDDWKSGSISRVTAADAQPSTPPATTPEQTTPPTTPQQAPAQQPMTQAPQPTTPPTTTPEQTALPQQPTTPPSSTPTVPPPSATDTERPVGTSGSLPKTASDLPLVGLIGLFALGGAVAIRIARAL